MEKEILMIFDNFPHGAQKKWCTGNKGTNDTIDVDQNNSSDWNDDGKMDHYGQSDVEDNLVEIGINYNEEQDWD